MGKYITLQKITEDKHCNHRLHISKKKTNQHNISPMSLNDIICSVMSPISKQYINIHSLLLIQKDQGNLQNNHFISSKIRSVV